MYSKFTIQTILKSILLIAFINSTVLGMAQSVKGLYVDDFKNIIGNSVKEDALLNYAKSNDFNYLILYNTTTIHRELYPLDKMAGQEIWKDFILLAKTKFNIQKIGVVGEKAASFIPAYEYNQSVNNNPLERIDVFNLEFEFWNQHLYKPGGYYCKTYLEKQGYACSDNGAFDFYLNQLKEMQKMKVDSSVEIETYIGNPTDKQLVAIAKIADRLLIHYYRTKMDNLAFYKLNRLLILQGVNPDLEIIPIFSSRENHLGPWLKTHQLNDVPKAFFDQLKAIREIDTQLLNIDGVIWYRYSSMPKGN